MTSILVRPEDRLDGVLNFSTWKVRVMNILEEHDLDQFVANELEIPTSAAGRSTFKKNQAKAKRIIFDSVKDSIMTVLTLLTIAKECFDTLTNLYEKKIPSQKRVLKTKLRYLKMEKGESISEFFTKISQIRDQLQVAGVKVDEDHVIQTVFDGLPSSWETFLSSVTRRENQPDFESLWHDCLQEEGCIQNKSGPPKEDHVALAARFSKRKRFFTPRKFEKDKTSAGYKGKKFDVSRVRCFSCQKLGYFAKDCRSKK